MIDINQQNKFSFIKMSALSNDFIIFDYRKDYFPISTKQIQKISNRKTVGCDQIIVIKEPIIKNFIDPFSSQELRVNVEMDIYNCDGSISYTCGNATRCVAGLLFEENPDKNKIFIKTLAGILECNKISENLISVNMGEIKFQGNFIYENYNFYCVDVGNPHAVSFSDGGIDDKDFFHLGPQIENHSNFPNKTNVEFAQILDDNLIAVRVWERGSGETLACGSGACAVVACAIKNNLINSTKVTVKFRGGKLQIEYLNNYAIMTGEYQKHFYGKFDEEFFS